MLILHGLPIFLYNVKTTCLLYNWWIGYLTKLKNIVPSKVYLLCHNVSFILHYLATFIFQNNEKRFQKTHRKGVDKFIVPCKTSVCIHQHSNDAPPLMLMHNICHSIFHIVASLSCELLYMYV